MTIEEQVSYKAYMIAYDIPEDEEVKKEMGRKVLKPNYDKVAQWLYESMPPEIRDKFVQAFLHVDSLEEGAQKLLGVDSLEEAVLKLVRTKEQPKELLEFLRRNLEEGESVDSTHMQTGVRP